MLQENEYSKRPNELELEPAIAADASGSTTCRQRSVHTMDYVTTEICSGTLPGPGSCIMQKRKKERGVSGGIRTCDQQRREAKVDGTRNGEEQSGVKSATVQGLPHPEQGQKPCTNTSLPDPPQDPINRGATDPP
jgi:hypothetical protein